MDTNPARRLDAEGIPELEGNRPGIDQDTESEGIFPPADHPTAAGADPAYPLTAAEQRFPETVEERARREQPDVGARRSDAELGTGDDVPLLADPTDGFDDIDLALVENEVVGGGELGDEGSVGPEELAMHIRNDDEL